MAAGISSFEIDLATGKFLWVENPIKALSGIRGADNKLTTFSQRIHPEDVNVFTNEIVRAAKGGYDVITYRYRGIAGDGSIVHVKAHSKLYFNEKRRATRALGVAWDVSAEVAATEKMQLQAEHERKLLERLNIATDSAGISSWEIDLVTGRFLWIENPLKSVEYDNDENLDLAHFSKRIVVEDRQLMQQAIRKALKTNSDRIGFRYRAYSSNGAIVHVQTFARLMVDESGRPIRVLGVSWDVTREVAASEQLQHQTERLSEVERRLERASLSSSEGHWEAEMATGTLWCSSSFHALLGYLEGELEGRVSTFDVLVHADDHSIYHEALRKHLVHNEPYNVETRFRMASGEYRWFRMRGMAERNGEGQPTVMAGSIHDVHQQKLAEDALALAQRRFERAINGTQDGLWELDVSKQTAWCSPRLALLLGYPIPELESRNFLQSLIHLDDAAKVAKVTESHYRHNTPFDLELRLRTHGGDHRWYRARANAERDSNGRAVRLSGSVQDVTEARAAREDLVRATEAAEAASRAKSAFLANVSHEIRTPMNGIIGMTSLLVDTQLDRTQRDYANTIRGSADSLLTVINDLLDFSKIEAGKLDLENIEMDLRANVEDVGAMMAFQAANKSLELIINVHPDVPERVLGDPQRIRQCLINLLGNAIKFTKQGEIIIDVCVVGRHEGKVLTHFEIRDTGMGIPDATLKTLFQPFVQADSSTTRHFGGTGLGLSIVRRLVEMMGGQVGVVSKVGEGSNFFFTLSLEPKEDPIALNSRQAIRNAHILVVDDNATNRRVLDGLLTHQGYQVTCVDGGAAALELLRAGVQGRHHKFDIVITDFQMPDMDGVMLGEQITKDPLLAHLRMIMLTSLDRQGDSKHLASLGFAAYLTKPVRTRELIDCVTHVLSRETRQTEMRPMLTRNSLLQTQPQQKFSGHVLLVEDNLVNQKVAARFLERMGCTVHIAGNGADGVAMFKERPFDAVLMDLQMPIMDGLTATRAIREIEAGTSRRVPIIALTANAMRGDKERCEAAGMDGFLTKPLEVERLRDTLAKFGLDADRKAAQSEAIAVTELLERSVPAAAPPIDLARLNEITGGDPDFAKELIETFIDSCEAQIVEIDDAIAAADQRSLARSAHKLKGACANIHAEEMRLLVAHLESEALTTNIADLLTCNAQLQQAFARAKAFLSDPSVVPANVKAAS
jgi:PAS domain S-box-containing protein